MSPSGGSRRENMNFKEEKTFLAPFLEKAFRGVFCLLARSNGRWMNNWDAYPHLLRLTTFCIVTAGGSWLPTSGIRRPTTRVRQQWKKIPGNSCGNRPSMAGGRANQADAPGPCFGYVSNTQRCWCPKPFPSLCHRSTPMFTGLLPLLMEYSTH